MSENNWIGVDLDGTLAYYETFVDASHIGDPIPEMLSRVKEWRRQGIEVRIVTARAALENNPWPEQVAPAIAAIKAWCWIHLGEELPVTASKDYAMIELWDDRCVQVGKNTGLPVAPSVRLTDFLRERWLSSSALGGGTPDYWCVACDSPVASSTAQIKHREDCLVLELI